MIPRYTNPEMGRIWSEQRRYETWLQVEIAAAEAMAAGPHYAAADMHLDVVPVMQLAGDRVGALGVSGAQVGHRLVGEHDAPAERVLGAVAFGHRDRRIGVAPLEEQRRIQPSGTSTHDQHAHHRPPQRKGTGGAVIVRRRPETIKDSQGRRGCERVSCTSQNMNTPQ